jgi:hypothetical protein
MRTTRTSNRASEMAETELQRMEREHRRPRARTSMLMSRWIQMRMRVRMRVRMLSSTDSSRRPRIRRRKSERPGHRTPQSNEWSLTPAVVGSHFLFPKVQRGRVPSTFPQRHRWGSCGWPHLSLVSYSGLSGQKFREICCTFKPFSGWERLRDIYPFSLSPRPPGFSHLVGRDTPTIAPHSSFAAGKQIASCKSHNVSSDSFIRCTVTRPEIQSRRPGVS